ncbi:MAG: hypothetical protein MZW92_14870 [Comamonadaceae bacterium]|nr:hypothetical protein [Comamonadaceae bacterium]
MRKPFRTLLAAFASRPRPPPPAPTSPCSPTATWATPRPGDPAAWSPNSPWAAGSTPESSFPGRAGSGRCRPASRTPATRSTRIELPPDRPAGGPGRSRWPRRCARVEARHPRRTDRRWSVTRPAAWSAA